jgi:excisionase family DNA binding protein
MTTDGWGVPTHRGRGEVAELLGMNVQMVRRYAREGRLPAYKLPGGRTLKFFRDEIYEFIRSHPAAAEDEITDARKT